MELWRRTSRWFLALLVFGLAACEVDQTGPTDVPVEPRLQTVTIDGVDIVLHPGGNPLVPSGWVAKVIGPDGGSISTDGASLAIPPQALLLPTTIWMKGKYSPEWKYWFGPSGLRFQVPSRLDIVVDPALLSNVDPATLKIAGSDDLGLQWQVIEGSGYDSTRGVVSSPIHHFSQYALCIN